MFSATGPPCRQVCGLDYPHPTRRRAPRFTSSPLNKCFPVNNGGKASRLSHVSGRANRERQEEPGRPRRQRAGL